MSLVHRDNGYIHKRDLYSITKQVFVYIKLASNLLKSEQSQLEVILFRKILRKLIPLTVTVTLSLTLSLTLTTTLTLNCICKFNSQSKSKIKYTIPQTVILSVTLTMTSTRICICKFNSKSKIKYTIENNKYLLGYNFVPPTFLLLTFIYRMYCLFLVLFFIYL